MLFSSMRQAYSWLLTTVIGTGNVRKIAGKDVLEICGVGYTVSDPIDLPTEMIIKTAKTYSDRINPILFNVIKRIVQDPTTRQAVLPVWNPNDTKRPGHVPCVISYQFLLRNNKLKVIIISRSCDVMKLLPADMGVFIEYQNNVVSALKKSLDTKIEAGEFTHIIGSAHVYLADLYKRKTDQLTRKNAGGKFLV